MRLRPFLPVLVGMTLGLASGCGYTLQHTKNPLLDQYGVRKIFIQPLRNDTFKPGVENLVYNELVKVIAANRRVEITQQRSEADAILSGVVTQAVYAVAGSTTADQLFPLSTRVPDISRPSSNIAVASSYTASLAASFSLNLPGKRVRSELLKDGEVITEGKVLWGGSFSRNQNFPGNNQIGEFGTTSALLNESEFDRALRELAQGVMASFHESMLAQF